MRFVTASALTLHEEESLDAGTAQKNRKRTEADPPKRVVSGELIQVKDPSGKGASRVLVQRPFALSPARDVAPAVVAAAGPKAAKRFLTFFTDNIPNENTREAYYRNAMTFYLWCEGLGLTFEEIQSYHVAAYRETLANHGNPRTGRPVSKKSQKQHLSAIRMLYDWLIIGHVVASNPAQAVRGPKVVVKKGVTPHLDEEEARHLLESIDTSSVVGLRDRALIGLMTYTFARVQAAISMNVADYFPKGTRWRVRLHEKAGKDHEMLAHHKLEEFMVAYLDAVGIREHKDSPLFSTAYRKTKRLTANRMHRVDVWRMIRRRAKDVGIETPIGCHTFRATGITNYLKNGGTLDKAQQMANHESSRTTGLCDHRSDELNLDEIERIRI